jgi:hydroxymethylpyrimidine/phosphomethylpyrimidine kinase
VSKPAAVPPRALAIGGLDPSAGAGVLLDAFVMARLGYQPAAVAATVTAQNSAEFLGQWPVAPDALLAQLDAVAAEGPIACAKIGALGSAENALTLAEWLAQAGVPVVVFDPVLVSSSGGELLGGSLEAVDAVARVATVVTPNAEEAARLAPSASDAEKAATVLAERWACDVVVTGLPGSDAARAVDLAATPGGATQRVEHGLVPGVGDVRGTGCMFASALACALADGRELGDALAAAQASMRGLLGEARPIGRGRWQVDLAAVAARAPK